MSIMQPHYHNFSNLTRLLRPASTAIPHRKNLQSTSRRGVYSFVQSDYPWRLIQDNTDPEPVNPRHIKNVRLVKRKRTTTSAPRATQPRRRHPKDLYSLPNPFSHTRVIPSKMTGYKLLCLENPLLDIQAPDSTPSLLKKYNLKSNDAILAEDHHKSLYADLAAQNAIHIAGGAAQNTARGAAYILPSNRVLYIGAVGADDAAETLRSASAAAGLATEYMVVPDVPTGRCGVVISGRDRSLCTDLAAANEYKLSHLQSPKIWAHAQAAQFFYVGSFHLTVCVPAVEALGKEAVSANKTFVLNLSAPFLPSFFKDQLATALGYADIVIGNESEAAAWAETQGVPEGERGDVAKIARIMATTTKHNKSRKRTVVITQGTDETVVVEDGKDDVLRVPIRAVEDKEVCDTNGAGDAFAGGFMAGLVEGEDVKTCVDMGHWLANLSIRELGPSYPKQKLTYSPSS